MPTSPGPSPTELHVFEAELSMWVIASSPEDAQKVQVEYEGTTTEEAYAPEEWARVSADKVLSIRDDGTGETSKRTAAEWIARQGRGFLCSDL